MEDIKDKDLMKMNEGELSDYLDLCITHKIEKQELPKDVTIEQIYRDIYKHIRMYFRILQLQLNFLSARADSGKYFGLAITKFMDKDMINKIITEVERLKNQDNLKTLNEIKKLK